VRQSMSASAEKATRRDLRRALGAGAIRVIDSQTQAIHAQTHTLQARVLPSLSTHAERLERLDDHLQGLDVAFTAFSGRSFWQRLRWLVTGR